VAFNEDKAMIEAQQWIVDEAHDETMMTLIDADANGVGGGMAAQ
jgi:hypothetical protein